MFGKDSRATNVEKLPVSSHPLFPAIVSLWFGALFGLGSLVIRSSLLESVILATQLDTVIPSAAPPLGVTFRIFLALALAAIGAIIGGVFARMIARPKATKLARVRKAGSLGMAPDAEMRGPASFGKNSARSTPVLPEHGSEPVRRRPLSVSSHIESEQDNYNFRADSAPLPGGSPEIFDVNAPDLAKWKTTDSALDVADDIPNTLELSAIDSSVPEAFNISADEPLSSGDPLDYNPAEQDLSQIGNFTPIATDSSIFDPLPADIAAIEASNEAQDDVAFQYDDSQLNTSNLHTESRRFDAPEFGSTEIDVPEIDGQNQESDASEAFAQPAIPVAYEAANFDESPPTHSGSGFEFGHTGNELGERPEEVSEHRKYTGDSAEMMIANIGETKSPTDLDLENCEQGAIARVDLDERIEVQGLTAPAADLNTLTHAELLDRLANSIRTRNNNSAILPVADNELLLATPVANDSPIATAKPTTTSHLTVPAALKPINFSEYLEEDENDSFVPLRGMVMPKAITTASPEDNAALTAEVSAIAPSVEMPAEPDVAEDEYSSLLDMTRPSAGRPSFVRIDEPTDEDDGIETVVVFPGHGGQAGGRFAAPSAYHPEAEPAGAANAAAIQPEFAERTNVRPYLNTAQSGAPAIDPAETERALRSALASLQRMTGTA